MLNVSPLLTRGLSQCLASVDELMAGSTEISELIADIREQVLYMQELGVEGLDARIEGSQPQAVMASQAQRRSEISNLRSEKPSESGISNLRSDISDKPERTVGSRLAGLPSLATRKSPVFFDKYNPGGEDERRETGDKRQEAEGRKQELPEPAETIEQIRAEIGANCSRCPLHAMGRRQVVNSVGNFDADLMFVGEAPGADEDLQGEPFVGRAGQLLTDIIEKGLQMRRQDVFIGNINRCRPPENRTPLPEEAVVCKPFLLREIAVVRPKVIVVLGAHAAQTLLETKTPISKLRGHFHDLNGVKVMPTFHPAYLLRDPNKKREVWEDIKMVRDHLRN